MSDLNASPAGEFLLGGEQPVHRLGFGAMRVTGAGIWGEPPDRAEALRTLWPHWPMAWNRYRSAGRVCTCHRQALVTIICIMVLAWKGIMKSRQMRLPASLVISDCPETRISDF